MDAFQIVKELAAGGFATFLVAILVAGRYRIWVWGYVLDEVVTEKNKLVEYERARGEEWKQLALTNRELVERSVTVVSKAVGG
jgi:hypothetical protein